MGKYSDILKIYNADINTITIDKEIEDSKNLIKTIDKDILVKIFECIDLTSLNISDTQEDITNLVYKINDLPNYFPEIENTIASICTYPIFIPLVKDLLTENINICTVTGFPNPQTFLEIKIAETALAENDGANEIDTVISVSKILENKYDEVGEEIEEIKYACRNAKLKVILETGELKDYQHIYNASIIAMYAGADFIKTSTGKTSIGATPESAYIICQSINDFYQKTNQKIGFKVAGGIKTIAELKLYYLLTEKMLGKDWMNKELFRIGTSKLANNLLAEITNKTVNYF